MFNYFQDQKLKNFSSLIGMVLDENRRQLEKWGVQVHTSFEWLTYTAEELGSLAKAIGEFEHREGPTEKVVAEAIQVATLSLKIAEMFMAGSEGWIKSLKSWEKENPGK
jgi:hypothetical protein